MRSRLPSIFAMEIEVAMISFDQTATILETIALHSDFKFDEVSPTIKAT